MELTDANLTLEHAAWLITVGEGLAAVGRMRTGKTGGQFSLHNFRLRAAYEAAPPNGEAGGGQAGPLVILMRAGVFQRHTWFMRIHPLGPGDSLRLELPGPIGADWDWWSPLMEIHDRLATQPLWEEATGNPFEQRVQEWTAALAHVVVTPAHGPEPQPFADP